MSTHNIGFYEDLTKIIFELSSNTHLISSAVFEFCRKQACRSAVLLCRLISDFIFRFLYKIISMIEFSRPVFDTPQGDDNYHFYLSNLKIKH